MQRDTAQPPAGLVLAGEEATPATTARLRLAHELHDALASAIVVIGVQAGVAEQALDRGEAGRKRAREALRTIQTASRQALAELRATVATLRGGSGTPGPPYGVDQLEDLTSLAAGAGMRVDLTVYGAARRASARRRPGRLPDRAGGADQCPPPRRTGHGHGPAGL